MCSCNLIKMQILVVAPLLSACIGSDLKHQIRGHALVTFCICQSNITVLKFMKVNVGGGEILVIHKCTLVISSQ